MIDESEPARHLLQLPLDASNQQLKEDVDASHTFGHWQCEDGQCAADRRTVGTFDVISAGLGFDYGRKIYEIEHLIAEHGDVLEEPERSAFEVCSRKYKRRPDPIILPPIEHWLGAPMYREVRDGSKTWSDCLAWYE